MKALNQEQTKRKGELIDEIRTAHNELDTAVQAYNTAMAAEKIKVEEKLETLNEKIRDSKEWLGDVHSDMDSYFDERSEKWQEGENGQNYSTWKDTYDQVTTDDVTIDFPDDLDLPDCETPSEMEDLADEP